MLAIFRPQSLTETIFEVIKIGKTSFQNAEENVGLQMLDATAIPVVNGCD